MPIKSLLILSADDIKILVLNKMNNILRNIDNNSKGEIRNQIDSLKNLILKY